MYVVKRPHTVGAQYKIISTLFKMKAGGGGGQSPVLEQKGLDLTSLLP